MMRGMTRRIILAVVWAYAAWIWTSMAHVLLGIPDFGPAIAVLVGSGVLLYRVTDGTSLFARLRHASGGATSRPETHVADHAG